MHNEKSVTANNVKYALTNCKKLLLTATPIQNNLMDLYGLVSVVDENIFGDKATYRHNYIKNYDEYEYELNLRLKNVLHRTLRQQVSHYIKFTNRIPKTFSFIESEEEKEVYDLVRKIILNAEEETYLIPAQQRHLVVLVLCKLLGSSTAAIISTLSTMRERLYKMRESGVYEVIDEVAYYEVDVDDEQQVMGECENNKDINLDKLNHEIAELEFIIEKASRIKVDSKYNALVESLGYAFEHLKAMGAEEKVLIFTESRKTQQQLYQELSKDGYKDILLYNGSNNDENSKEIYKEWVSTHSDSDAILNSKSVNMREAILDKFKSTGKILIATEAGAEGLNIQFCSLVINYDLPWNPQKVEQRIGRCHRFGQKYDVVVINFIGKNNIVEQRIYELLNNKFKIFDEILGSSDSIIGSLDDGKDIENAILDIYLSCRSEAEINAAFEELQNRYRDEIDEAMKRTRKELLDNFEEDVQELFKTVMGDVEVSIGNIERLLWKLTKSLLINTSFNDESHTFKLKSGSQYFLAQEEKEGYIAYNLHSLLGKEVIDYAKTLKKENGKIIFNISSYEYNLTKIIELKGRKGILELNKVVVKYFENEECLIFNGILDDETRIDSEICEKLFRLDTSESYGEITEKNFSS